LTTYAPAATVNVSNPWKGARPITANHADFQTIRTYRAFDLELW
jgi:hypothetical protein